MDEPSPIWADIRRDLTAAQMHAMRAGDRDATLSELSDAEDRTDREMSIAMSLHHCYSASEAAIERVIRHFDKEMPKGRDSHVELLKRAASEMPGIRPAIISKKTLAGLRKLLSFRHVVRHAYEDFDYDLARENVPVAREAIRRFVEEMTQFMDKMGLHPPDSGKS